MKRGYCLLLLGGLCLCFTAKAESFKIYKGAFFSICYPASFKVQPQQKSATGPGYDAVSFVSPDGLAEFYVFSPQWRGEPEWIKRRAGEKQISYSVEENARRRVVYVTRKGLGYLRSYVDVYDKQSGTRHVFGFRYKNQAAYRQYLPLYLKFKHSLEQYSD